MILAEAPPTGGLPLQFRDLLATEDPGVLKRTILEMTGAPDAVITCSGTAALVLVFAFLRKNSARRTVVIPAYTCPLVALAALHAGLKVVTCDTTLGCFDLDPVHLSALVDSDTLCVVPTHYGGALTDLNRVLPVLQSRSSAPVVVEDAAQAFGATIAGDSVGMIGDVGVFSFSAGKGFTIYEGGSIVSRDARLLAELRQLSQQLAPAAFGPEFRRIMQLVGHYLLYNKLGVALTYGRRRRYWLGRGDRLRAADEVYDTAIPLHQVGRWRMSAGASALKRFPDHLKQLQARFADLECRLAGLPGVDLHSPRPGVQPSGTYRFLTFQTAALCNDVMDLLWSMPWGVSKPCSLALGEHPNVKGKIEAIDAPNARDLVARTIALTTSPIFDNGTSDRLTALLASVTSEHASRVPSRPLPSSVRG